MVIWAALDPTNVLIPPSLGPITVAMGLYIFLFCHNCALSNVLSVLLLFGVLPHQGVSVIFKLKKIQV